MWLLNFARRFQRRSPFRHPRSRKISDFYRNYDFTHFRENWIFSGFHKVSRRSVHGFTTRVHDTRSALLESVQIKEIVVLAKTISESMVWKVHEVHEVLWLPFRPHFILKKQHGKITALIVYVDEMVVTGNDPDERKALQSYLSSEFKMKDLGHLKYFLGIEVSRSDKGIFCLKENML